MLGKKFSRTIVNAGYQTKQLHGGIIGNVMLVAGTAEADGGEKLPYEVVLKIQKKWARQGDPDSWHREFDLCVSGFESVFSGSLRWAECYRAEMNAGGDETHIWMDFTDGVSGKSLTAEMLERASEELGRFQGRLYRYPPPLLQTFANLSRVEDVRDYYTAERRETDEYRYIRSAGCTIPAHLRDMLIYADNETEAIYANHYNMPVVLCHRDFWIENIIYTYNKIVLIDWDSTGWGYMFEDIIQLVTDTVGTEYLDYYGRLIPAYLRGFSEYADIPAIDNDYIWKMLVIKFGYGPVGRYLAAQSAQEKALEIAALEKVWNLRGIEFIKPV